MKMNRMSQAFTLVEVMVVLVILSILASLIVPKIMSRPDDAKLVKAKQDILAIQSALDLYKLDNGFYPTNEQGLKALVKKPQNEPLPTNWKPDAYLRSLPKDPWGMPYQYLNPGEHSDIDIFSFGADKKPGGTGMNADLGNWQDEE